MNPTQKYLEEEMFKLDKIIDLIDKAFPFLVNTHSIIIIIII